MKHHELTAIKVSITDDKALDALTPDQFKRLFEKYALDVHERDGWLYATDAIIPELGIKIPTANDSRWLPAIKEWLPVLADMLYMSELEVYAELVGLSDKKPRVVIIRNEPVGETHVFIDRDADIKELVVQDDKKWYKTIESPGQYVIDMDEMDKAMDTAFETYRPQLGAHGSKNLFFVSHLLSILKRVISH